MLRKAARLPVILAVIGAFLNSGDLLAEFQPVGRGWVGYVAAASVGIALYLCVEMLLSEGGRWPVVAGVVFFGLAEVSGQVLHAALVRSDVAVMTDTMRWLMGYFSPSLVVIAGVVMAFVVKYGFVDELSASERPVTVGELVELLGAAGVSPAATAATAAVAAPAVAAAPAAPAAPVPADLKVNGNGHHL